MSNPTYRQFFEQVLKELNIKNNAPARRALAIVSIAEGMNSYWNPMNWVLPDNQGFPNWNSVGVKMYPDWKTGAHWTAYNLANNSRWATFVKLLGTSTTREPILVEMEKIYESWGAHLNLQQFTTQQAIDRLAMVMPGK